LEEGSSAMECASPLVHLFISLPSDDYNKIYISI